MKSKKNKMNAGQTSSVPPKEFPDAATCRVTIAGLGSYYFKCLSVWNKFCPHALSFAKGRICLHWGALGIWEHSKRQK